MYSTLEVSRAVRAIHLTDIPTIEGEGMGRGKGGEKEFADCHLCSSSTKDNNNRVWGTSIPHKTEVERGGLIPLVLLVSFLCHETHDSAESPSVVLCGQSFPKE